MAYDSMILSCAIRMLQSNICDGQASVAEGRNPSGDEGTVGKRDRISPH